MAIVRRIGRPSELRDKIHKEAVLRNCSDEQALAAMLNEYGRPETAKRLGCSLFSLDKVKDRMGVGAIHSYVVLPEVT